MKNTLAKKRKMQLFLTAMMSVVLVFGATACGGNDNGGTDSDIIIEGDSPDMGVPDAEPDADMNVPDADVPDADPDADVPDMDADAEAPDADFDAETDSELAPEAAE